MFCEEFFRGIEDALTRRQTSLRPLGNFVIQKCTAEWPTTFPASAISVFAPRRRNGNTMDTHIAPKQPNAAKINQPFTSSDK
jgi:hypothetical protein